MRPSSAFRSTAESSGSQAVPSRLRVLRHYRKRQAMQRLGYDKVFCIGAGKTGTSSLATAFVRLGFRYKGWDPALWECLLRGDYEPIFAVADRFEAFRNGPWDGFDFYRKLDERYPSAKFILTIRDTESWLRVHELQFSAEDGLRRIPAKYWIYGYADKRDEIARRYERRNDEILAHFAGRPAGKLLVLEICDGEGWKELCPFLGFPVPREPFPHANRAVV